MRSLKRFNATSHQNKYFLERRRKMKKVLTSGISLVCLLAFSTVCPVWAADEPASLVAQEAVKAGGAAQEKMEEAAAAAKININTADLETLANIKGIGAETAQNIINHRKEVGAFEQIEDLKSIKGIGEETLEQIRPFITLH
jgi:comEA protein